MTINTSYGAVSKVIVSGTIDSIENSDKIIDEIKNAYKKDTSKQVQLVISDSYIMLSRLIGNLLKLINVDGVNLKLLAGEDNLIVLLTKLGLNDAFQLEKI